MKRWLKRTLIGVFGLSILAGSLAACGHRSHHGGWNMSEADANKIQTRVLERAAKELTLDEAQKQRLAALAGKLREQRLALLGNRADPSVEPRAQLAGLLAGPTFNRESAQAFVQAKTGAVQSKSPEVINAAADFFDSLRPEQQQQVREFINKRRGLGHRG